METTSRWVLWLYQVDHYHQRLRPKVIEEKDTNKNLPKRNDGYNAI